MSRWLVGLVLAARGLAPGIGAAQSLQHAVLRGDMAALDPSEAQGLHLAWGFGGGFVVTPHVTVLADFTRQNLADEDGDNSFWQTYVGASWEYAFGSAERYRRQVMVILRGGALMRPSGYDTAPYLGFGVGLRYPVAPWIHFQARLEDDLDLPKGQTVPNCIAPSYCSPLHVGGHVEHNIGLFLGAEIHQY